jgi:flagellar protein FliO/FliZ
MTKPNPLFRAVATATAIPGACLLALVCPCTAAVADTPTATTATGAKAATGTAGARAATGGTGENKLLNLGPASSATHAVGSGPSIVRTIVGLAIVIAVIWGLAWILRQVKGGRAPELEGVGLTSLGALTLSAGRSVHLVRAGSDYILLGSAEQGVVPIHRYSEEEAREAGLIDVIETTGRRSRRALLKPPAPAVDGEGPRHDPMRMPAPGSGAGVIDRLRELTVRR